MFHFLKKYSPNYAPNTIEGWSLVLIPLKYAVYRLYPMLYCLLFQSMLHPKEGWNKEDVCHAPGYWVA